MYSFDTRLVACAYIIYTKNGSSGAAIEAYAMNLKPQRHHLAFANLSMHCLKTTQSFCRKLQVSVIQFCCSDGGQLECLAELNLKSEICNGFLGVIRMFRP